METTDLTTQRNQAHAYIDRLPPGQLAAVRDLLESMLDPLELTLRSAPIEDEEISGEETQAALRSRQWFKNNGGSAFESVVTECGFTMEQILEQDPA